MGLAKPGKYAQNCLKRSGKRLNKLAFQLESFVLSVPGVSQSDRNRLDDLFTTLEYQLYLVPMPEKKLNRETMDSLRIATFGCAFWASNQHLRRQPQAQSLETANYPAQPMHRTACPASPVFKLQFCVFSPAYARKGNADIRWEVLEPGKDQAGWGDWSCPALLLFKEKGSARSRMQGEMGENAISALSPW